MEYAKLGSSNVTVSRVVLGTWAIGGYWWGGTDDDDAVAAIHKALDMGMNTLDTAPIYGFGHSEQVVGRAIKGRRDTVVVATKCGLTWPAGQEFDVFKGIAADGSKVKVTRVLKRETILAELEASLTRLGTDYVDLYQCHWPDPQTPIEETMEALSLILKQGKARAIGVSNFPADLIARSLACAPITSDQPLYNMLDRGIEHDVLPLCRKHGLGVIVYSPLLQGLLTGAVSMSRTFPEGDQRNWKPWFQPKNRKKVLDLLDKVQPLAEKHGRTLGQVAINWLLQQQGVTAAIVGARKPDQVWENAGAVDWKLDEDDVIAIRLWLNQLGGPE